MPSDKGERKQVIVDRALIEQVRKFGRKFQLTDRRDAAIVDAALREWIGNQKLSGVKSKTRASQTQVTSPGHEHRLRLLMQSLRATSSKNGRVGPIGYKALSKLASRAASGEQLSPTFARKGLAELVARGDLVEQVPRAGSVGAVYRIVKLISR